MKAYLSGGLRASQLLDIPKVREDDAQRALWEAGRILHETEPAGVTLAYAPPSWSAKEILIEALSAFISLPSL